MFFGNTFHSILKNRKMKLADLAERAKIDESVLEAAIKGDFDLNDAQVECIAQELAVPSVALFSHSELPLSNVPDFRRRNPSQFLFDSSIIKAIGFVEKISLSLAALGVDLSSSEELEKYTGPINKKSAKELAKKWRNRWGITDAQQLEWKSSSEVYSSLREYIESLGVFVMHHSFGTDEVAGLYAKVDGGPHTILINTSSSSKARKLFTLAHEFCHVLLRANGVSNPSILKNKIEVFCNQFAAFLLAPDSLISSALARYRYLISIDNDSIRLLAQNIGISQQACVLRLVDTDRLKSEDYARWMSRFQGVIPDGDRNDPGGGGGGGDPIKNKRTQYGHSLLSKLRSARKDGLLDAIEIYRLAGIKPKYQQELLGG